MRPSSKVFCTGRLDIPEALIDDFVGISVFGDFLSCLAVRDESAGLARSTPNLTKVTMPLELKPLTAYDTGV